MTTETPTGRAPDTPTTDLTATDIFPLLAHDRRRNALHYLAGRAGSVPLGELAEQLAIWEDDPTHDQYERILTSLYHIHLPKLAEAGVIDYKIEQETVTGLTAIDTVRPYLDLAIRDDHH
jgi:hypothetical protein